MVSTRLMTAEELERLPDDDNRYELIEGELVAMAAVKMRHFRVAGNVHAPLHRHATERNLGIVGFEGGFVVSRGPDTVLVPDVAFVRADRWPDGDGEDHFGEVAPDLAVEVRSPSESMRSLLAKARRYIAAGVLLVWLIDPDTRTVLVFVPGLEPATLTDGDVLDGGDVVPGFRLPVSDVFR